MSFLRSVRLIVPAGAAKPGPAIGQALGPLGLNMMDFCKAFNADTTKYVKDTPMRVTLSAYNNRTFTFEVKAPRSSYFIKKCAGVEKGSSRPVHEVIGSVHVKDLYEIAKANY